jgi:integrase/recombinase XerC
MIDKLLKSYEKELITSYNVQTTINRKHYQIRKFLKWCNGKALGDVSTSDIEEYLYGVSSKRDVQVQNKQVIAHFFDICIKRKVIYENPAAEIEILTCKEQKIYQVPSHAEIRDMLERIRKTDTLLALRDFCMIELSYGSGARAGEIVAINIEDLNLSEKIATLYGKGRGSKKTRNVPLTDHFVKAVSEYCRKRNVVRGVLFVSFTGKRMSNTSVYQRFHLWTGRNPHIFRHAFATELLKNDCPSDKISDMLGHSRPTCISIYTHVSVSDLQADLNRSHPRSYSFQPKSLE